MYDKQLIEYKIKIAVQINVKFTDNIFSRMKILFGDHLQNQPNCISRYGMPLELGSKRGSGKIAALLA